MTRTTIPELLSFTPQILFPNIPNASLDPKCVVIAKVIEVWTAKSLAEGNKIKQKQLLDDAEQKYSLLSEDKRLALSVARQRVSGFVELGVSFATAKEYFGYLLSPVHMDEWRDFRA